MKQDFGELFEAIKNNRKYSPYVAGLSAEDYFKEMELEFNEVREALEKKDYINLQEEIGDLLWDLLSLSVILEDEGKIKSNEIITKILHSELSSA